MMKSKNETAETRRECRNSLSGDRAGAGADSFPLRPILAKRRFTIRSGSRAAVPSVPGCAQPVYPHLQKNRDLPNVSRRCQKRTFSTRSPLRPGIVRGLKSSILKSDRASECPAIRYFAPSFQARFASSGSRTPSKPRRSKATSSERFCRNAFLPSSMISHSGSSSLSPFEQDKLFGAALPPAPSP